MSSLRRVLFVLAVLIILPVLIVVALTAAMKRG